MSSDKDNEYVKIMRSPPVSLEEWSRLGEEWTMNNPEACEVAGKSHKMAQFFEDEQGYTRRMVCEGLLEAALELAFRRCDQKYIERPEDQRDFHLWALKRLKREIDITTSPQQQAAYEAELGERPLWLFDAENFGLDDDKKTRQ